MESQVHDLNPFTAFVGMFQDTTNRWFTLYLLASFLIACAVFYMDARHDPHLKEEGLLHYLFPKPIYTHRSAIADYWFFAINKFLFTVALGSLVVVSAHSSDLIGRLLASIAPSPELGPPDFVANFIVTCAWALAADFGLWLGHYLMHKVPVLWEFHKVHHSAEVLTPATAGRVHPLEDAINIGLAAAFGGAMLALCQFVFGPKVQMFGLLQLNVLVFAFYLFGFHLRHTHIWVPYKGIWGKLFISPAHHQLHHSVARRHWDKNLGLIFGIWDWMFGTLYTVDRREEITIGMNGHEEGEYHSVRAMYFLPFVKAWRLIRRRRDAGEALPTPHLPPAE